MVGLNHEFARELLWREYPTDQRGSYFRQFWDVRGVLDAAGLSATRCARQLHDIPRAAHAGRRASALGDHDNRSAPGGRPSREARARDPRRAAQEVPDRRHLRPARALGSASRTARSTRRRSATLDQLTRPRRRSRRRTKVRTPLYEAKRRSGHLLLRLRPDRRARRRAAPASTRTTIPGWFFVIKERPGEPRFGLDVERDGPLEVWNDLAWADVLPGRRRRLAPARARADVHARSARRGRGPGEGRPARRRRAGALGPRP